MPELLTRTTAGHRPEPTPELQERTYPKGRRCIDPGCITLLCYLNPGPRCFIHAKKHAAGLAHVSSAEAA